MIRARPILAAASLLALSACNLAPKYVRPDAPVAPSLPQGTAYPALAAGDGAIDGMGWQAFFTDQRLKDTIALALANNRDLRATVANVERARALYRVERAGQFPTIGASAGATVTHNSSTSAGTGSNFGSGTTESYSASANVSAFELDLFGRRRNMSRAAFESYLASDEGRKSAQIALVAEVANAWLTHAATADALAVARETLASQEQSLTVNSRREANGIGTALDVAQAQTQVDSARAAVADYTTSLAQAKNALDLLAGAPVDEALLPQTLGMGDQVLPSLPVGLDSGVLLRRPDVLQAEHQLKAANADIGVARAAFFPSISLTGLLGLASQSLSSLFSSDSFRWSAGGTASQTLFDFGTNAGNLAASKAARDAAVATYEGAVQTAFREVADALARRGTIDTKVRAQQSLADNAAKAARISQSRFANGVASYLEPLDAQRTAYSARQALVSARLAKATNMVELYRSLGGGLTP
ncbi:efflux transporter outer membrane subunit [Novosphingobium sp. KCTC 2891]|uniref:efflux transporter outer membrane subunit n=1 Tax=Novosphingobium sp. KCTC 2891 TaxID=2989730 RepID=UPI002221653F|nr:efflux transporter outer membrane subunit [Novosphingobium sp. KCTC 2891]MCW1381368.1 efflux transporter outer membrane subunit [Novosphingobium sp. KCTC 2891]